MQQDYFGFKRDKGGAAYGAPAGYTSSNYWSLYANSFAEDGSDDQLIAALTKSVPDAWLKAKGFTDPDTLSEESLRNGTFQSGYRQPTAEGLDRGSDYYLDSYTKGLQSRLRNQFKNERKGMEAQGSANLRAGAEDALRNDFKGIDADANARGLLFSGKRQAAQSAAAAQRAVELGQATTDYLQSLGDMERNLNSDVFKSEIDSSVRQADINDLKTGAFYNKLRRSAGDSAAQAQAAQNFGSGLGSISGALSSRLRRTQSGVA